MLNHDSIHRSFPFSQNRNSSSHQAKTLIDVDHPVIDFEEGDERAIFCSYPPPPEARSQGDVTPGFCLHEKRKMSDVLRGNHRADLLGLGRQDDVAIEFLGIGGQLTAAPGESPEFCCLQHHVGRDGQIVQGLFELIQPLHRVREILQQQISANLIVGYLGNKDGSV